MRETIRRTREPDGTLEVEVEIEGTGAFEAASEAVKRELDGYESDDIDHVTASVRVNGSENGGNVEPAPDTEGESGAREISRERLSPGTGSHEVAHILREANAEEDPMSSNELGKILEQQGDLAPQSASGALSNLYYSGLVDRDEGSAEGGGLKGYYFLTEWGESELDRVGPYPYDD